MAYDVADYLDDHMEELAEDLRQRLEEASGVEYVRRGTVVEPADEQTARIKEFGSATLAKTPVPFFDKTVKEWAQAHGIKGL